MDSSPLARWRHRRWLRRLIALSLLLPAAGWAVETCPLDPGRLARLQRSLQAQANHAPAPLPRLHTEGSLPHQGIYDQSVVARHDLSRMRQAALVWQAGQQPRWLQMASQYLLAWVQTYQPSLNPIDETSFDALIQTYVIIRPRLTAAESAYVRDYLRSWAERYIQAMRHPGRQGTWRNNWQSHRVKLVTLMAVASQDPALFRAARELFRQQLDANLLANGEVIDFRQRDALHYVVYDLQPLLQAALAARQYGEDWYHWRNRQGASLASAMAWLQPYAEGQRRHREFVHSHVRFDAIRARAGIRGFKGDFDPSAAGTIYWLAASWDPSLQPLAKRLQPRPPWWLVDCPPHSAPRPAEMVY